MKKWRYIALIPVIIIGVLYLAWCYYFQKNPITEVGGTKADIFYTLEEFLYVPDSGVPVDTYADKETGDYIMVNKTEVSIFFVTGNTPREQLDSVFTEYMNYLIKRDIAV